MEKKEYLKGKSIIYKQHNFEKHEHPKSDILNRYNPNMIDQLSRHELKDAVMKLREIRKDHSYIKKGGDVTKKDSKGIGKMKPYPLTA